MKNATPNDHLTYLYFFRIGLEKGLYKKQEIISWVDAILTEDTVPDIFFIELSLCKDVNAILAHLDSFLISQQISVNTRPLLALLYQHILTDRLPLTTVLQILYDLKDEEDITEKEINYIHHLEYAHELVEYYQQGTIQEVKGKVISFLEIYKDYILENLASWPELDLLLNDRLDEFDRITTKN